MASSTASTIHPRRNHALHNEAVCCYLELKPDYGDWVITTAFYSALHWLHHHFFPCQMPDGTECKTFDEYKIITGKNTSLASSHQILIDLAFSRDTNLGSRYKRLYSACLDARYKDYRPAQSVVTMSTREMQAIRDHCEAK